MLGLNMGQKATTHNCGHTLRSVLTSFRAVLGIE
jgi:hypothetical protein